MKKLLSILVIIVFAASFSLAQHKNHVSIGANVSLPLGSFSDFAGVGFGGTATFEMAFTPNITGVATAGYLKFGGKDLSEPGYTFSYSYSDIPIMVGAKYYFTS